MGMLRGMKLDNYRTLRHLTYRKLAEHLGITLASAYGYCTGRRRPRPDVARHIETRTAGMVSAVELVMGDQEPPPCN